MNDEKESLKFHPSACLCPRCGERVLKSKPFFGVKKCVTPECGYIK